MTGSILLQPGPGPVQPKTQFQPYGPNGMAPPGTAPAPAEPNSNSPPPPPGPAPASASASASVSIATAGPPSTSSSSSSQLEPFPPPLAYSLSPFISPPPSFTTTTQPQEDRPYPVDMAASYPLPPMAPYPTIAYSTSQDSLTQSSSPSLLQPASDQQSGPIYTPPPSQSPTQLMTMETYQASLQPANALIGPGGFPDSNGFHTPDRDSSSQKSVDTEDSCRFINFVYANEKRLSDFHSLFRSVPEDEKLIEDYGCALQKEILVQGRLYISDNHVCFNANIFGWVTTLVIAFSEITAIEKRLTAFVIPNAISIVTTTNTKGHFFASFLSRDAAHDLLMAAWRKSFPCAANASANSNSNAYFRQLNRSNNGLNDDETEDGQSSISGRANSDSRKNRHRRSFSNASQTWTGDEAGAGASEQEEFDKTGLRRRGSRRAVVRKILKEVIAPIIPDEDGRNGSLSPGKRMGRGRSVSELPPRPSSLDSGVRPSMDHDLVQRTRAGSEAAPASRAQTNEVVQGGASVQQIVARSPTACACSKDGRHYANQFMSETYPGTVEALWKILFDSEFTKQFLTGEAMKGADVQEDAWQKAANGTMSKVTKYIKWLGMPIGPKTTKAILTDVCESKNFDEYVTTVTTTSTPDVPSGGSFTTKCRTCITWAGPNQVRIVVTGAVEFSKSSWIKGQIEKGAAEGMGTHYKELNTCLRKHLAAHPVVAEGGANSGTAMASVTPITTGGVSFIAAPLVTSPEALRQGGADGVPVIPARGTSIGATTLNTSNATVVNSKQTKSATTSGSSISSAAGVQEIWSALVKSLQGDGKDSVPQHLTLIAVLMAVMLANVYIWLQISSVSSRIELIQAEAFMDRSSSMGRGGSGGAAARAIVPASAYQDADAYRSVRFLGVDEAFEREQEEAMWAWLTEREERHRRYRYQSLLKDDRIYNDNDEDDDKHRYDNAKTTTTATNTKKNDSKKKNRKNQGDPSLPKQQQRSATEIKLQARIDDLQQQLAALELQASFIEQQSQSM